MLKVHTIPLPAKTHHIRELKWTPIPLQPVLTGVMEVCEQKKPTHKVKVRKYLVKLESESNGERRFQVIKPGGIERHFVCLKERGHDECVCVGFMKWGECTHTQAIRALAVRGHLQAPKAG